MPLPTAIIATLLLSATVLIAAGVVWTGSADAGDSAAESAPQSTDGLEVGQSGLPLPRFASLGSSEVNLRTGPGLRYPVAWVFTRRGLPVVITAEFEHWRKIRDMDGAEGWVHQSMLSGRRFALVIDGIVLLRREPAADAKPVLRAEEGVLGALLGCQGRWCHMEIEGVSGWIHRAGIFGVLDAEEFD